MSEVGGGVCESGWRQCLYCHARSFKQPNDFLKHIRESHCVREGGSFVCRYGYNGVCSSLPVEGVSDRDYEAHVLKHHAFTMASKGSSGVLSRAQTGGREEKWGVFSSTQNLAAVLNDPRKGMKRDFFTKTWGEGFVEVKEIPPHVALPHVTTKHVESYVRRLRRRQKLLHRLRTLEESKEESEDLAPTSRVADQLSQDSQIPSIFLSSSFNLEDPDTFYSVFSHVTSKGVCTKDAKILQEKLFHYLENVEVDMCRQIARKSSAFFDTMTYLNAQMTQLKLNHQAVSSLRSGISKLRQEAVLEPAKILALPRRRHNIAETCRKVEVMGAVREVQSTIQVMLARQEFTAALDLISTTQDLLHSELATVRSLKHLSSELSEHEKLIDKMVSADFIKYITEDLNRPLEDTRPFLEEDQLIAVVFGVLRLQKFDFLDNLREEIYAAIKATVKQSVIEAVSEVEVDQETASVADQARVLSIAAWLALLTTVTQRLNTVITRVKGMVEVMVQTVEAGAGRTQPATEGVQAASLVTMSSSGGEAMVGEVACGRVLGGLREVLCAACDYAHDRCAKLLHARARDHGLDKMTASEFLALSRTIEALVADTERVCGRKSTSFRMGLQGQATRFVARFHEEREARLKLNLSTERWRPVPAPPDLQPLLDHVANTGMLVSPPAASSNGSLSNGVSDPPPTNGSAGANGSASDPEGAVGGASTSVLTTAAGTSAVPGGTTVGKGPAAATISARDVTAAGRVAGGSGAVVVGGEQYVVVGVCVVVVRLIVEYAECATTLRLAAHQLLTRLTDLLRRFNSDTCRLLIEAGAVSLGLKTITTRNLALAWRSLALLLTMLPRLDQHFSQLLRPQLVAKNVEQVMREYSEHCDAIESKIVGVMGDTLGRLLATWEARSPVPSQAFSGVLKAVSKLHEAVSDVLPQQQMYKLFEKITGVLKEKLKVHLVRLNVSSVGPKSWVVTSELTFYFNHLESLGLGGLVSQEDFTHGLWPQR